MNRRLFLESSLAAAAPIAAAAVPDLPDAQLAETYRRAASQNVLAAVNPKVFYGYWCVCADGHGFGYGNTYPSLDGHQMSDALLWLGQADTVKANWDYVRKFQKPDGRLPIAILPTTKRVGNTPVEPNGGFYQHWVGGDPLRALGATTYIQNADVIYRRTLDRAWLRAQLASVNLAAGYLASLVTGRGRVGGAGYYIERPPRVEFDGVTQCHAADAFRRLAVLNRAAGEIELAEKWEALARRITANFQDEFWQGDRFAEYINPEHGVIASHGFTDVDWSAIACGLATPAQLRVLWPLLRNNQDFYYGGMPTGIATKPDAYQPWEFNFDHHDVAAMGRVWHLEAWARARMGDGAGLVDGLGRVARTGRRNGYYWRERYAPNQPDGNGPNTYCEYPANFIRIVNRFLFGLEFELDGALRLAPVAPESFWRAGFGQTLEWRDRKLEFRLETGRLKGTYTGAGPQTVHLKLGARKATLTLKPNARFDVRI